MKKTITSNDLKNLVNEAHAQVKDLKGGKNANYIPFLDKIDSNLFGISVCLSLFLPVISVHCLVSSVLNH